MGHSEGMTTVERLYGLGLIWQEANYNFAFFDRQPDLDWDGLYREYIPRVISAEDPFSYYQLLSRFTATLADGHTLIIPPQSLYLGLDRPKLMLMNVGNVPIVTNASSTTGKRIAIGSQLVEIDGVGAGEYLAAHVMPYISETTKHRLLDHAVAAWSHARSAPQVGAR
jgi:carboxyl-terminal processing protease